VFAVAALLVLFLAAAAWTWQRGARVSVLPTLSPDGYWLAAQTHAGRGHPAQALYHVEALALADGWTAERHRLAGDLWVRLGDGEQALFHREQAAVIAVPDAVLLQSLAAAYIERGRWQDVSKVLAALLALDPENAWANYHLGLLRAPFFPDEAAGYLRQAALDPQFSETARAVRVALIESRAAAEVDAPSLPMRVGLTLVRQRQWNYAELAFQQANTLALALTGDPLPEALAYTGLAQDQQGKDGAAVALAALRADPNDAQVRYLLALHYRHIEDYDASLNAMVAAVALSPDSPALYAELATAYRLLGDMAAAEVWLRAAVDYSGGAPEFQQMLDEFYAQEAFSVDIAATLEAQAAP